MAEYIERKKAIHAARYTTPMMPSQSLAIVNAVESIPAADVRPVVVCADCEHNNHCLTQEFVDDCGKIPLDRNTFFCADGERKSDD